MTAEIIELWLHRNPHRTMGKSPAQDALIAARHLQSITPPQRSTREIMLELAPLQMTGIEDEPKRQALIAELRTNSQPLNW